jgi:ABC-type multidrug transport system ATPase subunit
MPNGAGNTTTRNCMAGLLVPEEGGTEVFGAPVHPSRTEYRRDVGYVAEEAGFFQRWTAGRNLAFLRDGQIVLRPGRDELSERWRRVSFRLPDQDVEHAREGTAGYLRKKHRARK